MDLPFKFIQNKVTKKWVISSHSRSSRPKSKGLEPTCPFCPGREANTPGEVYRLDQDQNQDDDRWEVRVVPNKFPFAPFHELIIHSPDHHHTLTEMSLHQYEKLVWVYRHRIQDHRGDGTPFIFNNTGIEAGASMVHAHTQLVVIPPEVKLQIDPLGEIENIVWESKHFMVFVPTASGMPYEVWVAPKDKNKRGRGFWEVEDKELFDFAFVIQRVIKAVFKKFGHQAPFNYYLYPGGDWYWRLIPRERILGGFEVATGVFVNSVPVEEAIEYYKKELT